MSAVITAPVKFTYDDYLLLPEGNLYEIIDGDLNMVPAPLPYHQRVLIRFVMHLEQYTETNNLGKIYAAPIDIILSDADIVQPDIVFISNENMHTIKDENVQGAPDLVVEILSPSSIKRDRELKMKLYSRFGVKEYWIADPDEHTVEDYTFNNQVLTLQQKYEKAESMKSVLLHDLQIPLSTVFEK
jgi:Uma2 family endonuclease